MFDVGGADLQVGGDAGAVELPAGAGGGGEHGAVAERGDVAAGVELVALVVAGVVEVAEAGEFDDGVGVDLDAEAVGEDFGGAAGAEVGNVADFVADLGDAGAGVLEDGSGPAAVGAGGGDEAVGACAGSRKTWRCVRRVVACASPWAVPACVPVIARAARKVVL